MALLDQPTKSTEEVETTMPFYLWHALQESSAT
jgi:hypothetical protein